jgi:hypothetical protein
MKKNVSEKKNESKANSGTVHRKGIFSNAKNFAKTKPGFFVGIIIVLAMLLVILTYSAQPNDSPDKALQAKQIYTQNQAMLAQYLQSIEEQQKEEPATTLDDDYLASMKDDYSWLKNKETYLYNSKPGTTAYAREAAFTFFADIIKQINDYSAFEIGTPNYQDKINTALALEIKIPDLATEEELNEGLRTQQEREAFKETSNNLFKEYIVVKKELINNAGTIERKYVEAKKLIGLTYYDTNTEYYGTNAE